MPCPDIEALKKKWRNDLFSTDPWVRNPVDQFVPGDSRGFRVKHASVPYGGYLKPTKSRAEKNPSLAAHEKIAADLAADLGLPVPPVLLYDRPDAPTSEESRCCVSLVMYPKQTAWRLLFKSETEVRTKEIVGKDTAAWLAPYSGMHVFNLWVGQVDAEIQSEP